MHRNRTTTGLLLAGLLGLLLAGFGVFASPWPWVVVLGFGALRPSVARFLALRESDDISRVEDLRDARAALESAGLAHQKRVAEWEQRISGTLTPEEARQIRADFNAMVLDMGALKAEVEQVAKEQRARALAAPFTGGE